MRGEPTGIEGGDMLVETALGDEHSDQQGFSDGSEQVAATEPFDREPQRRRDADLEDRRDDAASVARDVASSFAIELAIKERDGLCGERSPAYRRTIRPSRDRRRPKPVDLHPRHHRVLRCRRETGRHKQ
jgi:hypothetical protein